jgi:hypothetical protein
MANKFLKNVAKLIYLRMTITKQNYIHTDIISKNIRDMYRGINDFMRGYQLRSNLVKDENGDLLADFHSILNRWKNYFSQLLTVHRVSHVRHTARPLVPDPSPFEVETAITKSESYKSPGSYQIPAELIQAGGEIILSKIHKLIILFGVRTNYLISGRSLFYEGRSSSKVSDFFFLRTASR